MQKLHEFVHIKSDFIKILILFKFNIVKRQQKFTKEINTLILKKYYMYSHSNLILEKNK